MLAAALPPELDGAGLGLAEQCSVLIELGRAASDVPYLTSVVLGAGAVAEFGTPAQQRDWAVPAGQGTVVLTAALAEEDGDDVTVPSTRAVRSDGQWVLSGVKTAVEAATEAGLFLVPASSPDGVMVFLVTPSDAGVTVEPQRLTDFGAGGAGRAGWRRASRGSGCSARRDAGPRWRAGWRRGPPWGTARRRPGSSSGPWS